MVFGQLNTNLRLNQRVEMDSELGNIFYCFFFIRDDTVELQGERLDMVEKFLKNKLKK